MNKTKKIKIRKMNKIKNKIKNKTKKKYKMNKHELICKQTTSSYTPFEEKIEELFKQNKINVSSASYNLEKEVIKNLKKAVNPSNVTPNNDYYSYINERWLNKIEITSNQSYIVQIDNFRLIQDKVYRELIVILDNYTNDPKTKHTKLGKCIKNAYASFKTLNTNKQTIQFAKTIVEYVDNMIASKDNLWKLLANSTTNEITSVSAPFTMSVNPDDKNPTIYKCSVNPPQVTLLDVDIYFDYDEDTEQDKKYKMKYKTQYFKYLNNMFKIAFGENHGFIVKNIFDCEVELLNAMTCDLIKEASGDEDNTYNLISKKEALAYFGFNWEEFSKEFGFKTVPENFITSNINYLLCGTKLLKEKWNTPHWRTYWIYIYIKDLCRWNERGWYNFYDFQGNFVRGQSNLVDPVILPIFGMGFTFNHFLTDQYTINYENKTSVDFVNKLANDLKIVFTRIIKQNKWMEPKTRQFALDKLNKLKFLIGSQTELRDDPLLDYKADDFWGNLVKMAMWRHDRAIELVGKKVIDIPVIDWTQIPPKFVSKQTYVVNAMYTPTENTVYIPLGYIQKPFVDLNERGIEYNLAYIGFTIAHELSHALDDFGSKYNAEGKLYNWWTKKDKESFRKIQENIVNQYEKYALYDGVKFDAWPSIGEDLADISGFNICQEYLRDIQLKNQNVLPIQALSFESFYIYFALQSRQKISKKSILAQLKTNPHPLDKYRCNVPLSRSNIFRAIYNVKKGNKMWWNNSINIW